MAQIYKTGAGGMGSKSRDDQISYTLPTTRRRCKHDVWALAQSCGDGYRLLVTPERVLSEYNGGFDFLNFSTAQLQSLNIRHMNIS